MSSKWRAKLTQLVFITNLQILLVSPCGFSIPSNTGTTNFEPFIKPLVDESLAKFHAEMRYLSFSQQYYKNFQGPVLPNVMVPKQENYLDKTHTIGQEKHCNYNFDEVRLPPHCYHQPLSKASPMLCSKSNNFKESNPSSQLTGFKMPLKVCSSISSYSPIMTKSSNNSAYPTTKSPKQNQCPQSFISSCDNIRSRQQPSSLLPPPSLTPALQSNFIKPLPLALDVTAPVVPSIIALPIFPITQFDVTPPLGYKLPLDKLPCLECFEKSPDLPLHSMTAFQSLCSVTNLPICALPSTFATCDTIPTINRTPSANCPPMIPSHLSLLGSSYRLPLPKPVSFIPPTITTNVAKRFESTESPRTPLPIPASNTILLNKDVTQSVSSELPLPMYNKYNSGYSFVPSPTILPKPYNSTSTTVFQANEFPSASTILSACPTQCITTCNHYSHPSVFNSELANCPKVPSDINSFLQQGSCGFVDNRSIHSKVSHSLMYNNLNTLRPLIVPHFSSPTCCNIPLLSNALSSLGSIPSPANPILSDCLYPGSPVIQKPFIPSFFEPSAIENSLLPTLSCPVLDNMSSAPTYISLFSPLDLPKNSLNSLHEDDISNVILESDLKAVKRSPDIKLCKNIFSLQAPQNKTNKAAMDEPETILTDISDIVHLLLELINQAEILNDNNECDDNDIQKILTLFTDF